MDMEPTWANTNNNLGASTSSKVRSYLSIQEFHVQHIFLGQYGYNSPWTMRSRGINESSDGGAHWYGLALEHVLF